MVIRSLFTNPDLPALKYGRTTEMEAANEFCDSTKKKYENLVITVCGLFVYKTISFIISPDRLLTCNCFEDACVEIKCSLSINYEKRNEKNLDYLYKSDSEINPKSNQLCFTQCIRQMAVTNKSCVTLLYGHPMVRSLVL